MNAIPSLYAATDRELLELAAKAAGMAITWDGDNPPYPRAWAEGDSCHPSWNPLTDDGDALRLAVKLGLEVYHTINGDEWAAFVGYPSDGRIRFAFEAYGADPLAATRRAIVIAAAEIGRSA